MYRMPHTLQTYSTTAVPPRASQFSRVIWSGSWFALIFTAISLDSRCGAKPPPSVHGQAARRSAPPAANTSVERLKSGVDLRSATDPCIRVATFNVSLFRKTRGKLIEDLARGDDEQAHRLATIIQIVRPDLLLLNEFDYDEKQQALELFKRRYLHVKHDSRAPIEYAYSYASSVNTGVPSGVDFDGDGKLSGNDCFGFGSHPGQYGMAVLSRFPIDIEATRTFQQMRWADMPGALLPKDPKTGASFYDEKTLNVFRLSSKSHWDVVVNVGQSQHLHLIASHPTPPVFDGTEDRNGKRNHDEIRLLADYIANDPSGYIVDDAGIRGGLADGSHFVVAGDLNADPHDGASFRHAARQLTRHPLVQSSPVPASEGALEQAGAGSNVTHSGNPAFDTADFDDRRTGNLRTDYVLPSKSLKVHGAGVFWPTKEKREHELLRASDHRLVWVDLKIVTP